MDGGYGGGEDGAVGVGEEEDGLGDVVDVGRGEAGVVFGEVDDGVFAGDIGGGDDGELVPGDPGVEVDGCDAAAGDGAADGGSEPHAGEFYVVDVAGAAEDLVYTLFAGWRGAYDFVRVGHRFGLARMVSGFGYSDKDKTKLALSH